MRLKVVGTSDLLPKGVRLVFKGYDGNSDAMYDIYDNVARRRLTKEECQERSKAQRLAASEKGGAFVWGWVLCWGLLCWAEWRFDHQQCSARCWTPPHSCSTPPSGFRV